MPTAVHTIAGRFEVEAESRSGGMGTIYRARDGHTGEDVAIKVLHARGSIETERFGREASLLASLVHPGIVKYVAHGTLPGGAHYLAMEWLDGETLAERLQRGRLSVADALALGQRLAEALAEAHRRGVAHRDLKPSNVILEQGQIARARLVDFGIAQNVRDQATLAQTLPVGTPGYMAPEQARGAGQLDARVDVFALGCVLYECITGQPAFVSGHLLGVLAKIVVDEPRPASELSSEVPPALDDLLRRMMDKDRDQRPADGAAVATELVAITRGGGPARVPSAGDEARRSPLSEELRVMSVVLAGEPVADGDDAASLRDAEQAIRVTCRPYGARVEFLASQSLLVLISGTGAAADQAARAARLALELSRLLPDRPLVVATGRAFMSGERSPGKLPVGEVIDAGAKALKGAPAGAVSLDEMTASLLDARFDVQTAGAAPLLVGERPEEAPRTLLGRPTTCVGRDRELATLEGIFGECIDEPVARAVLITAPPGVGKSRVLVEFLGRAQRRAALAETRPPEAKTPPDRAAPPRPARNILEELGLTLGEPAREPGAPVAEVHDSPTAPVTPEGPLLVLWGRGDPLSTGSPFGLIAPAIRRAAGIQGSEPLEVRRAKLRARAGRHLPRAGAQHVADFLGELVGVPFPDDRSDALRAARSDAMLMGDAIRAAWEGWLRAECTAHPVLIVLDDLQWGDLPTTKMMDAALRNLRDCALMIIAVARPEVHDLFPGLWAERELTQLRLAPLTRRAAQSLATQALGDGVPQPTLDWIIDRAEGNAFFLEELIRAVAAGKADTLPDTVLGTVQARLDALGPQARRVLRAASVFGQSFTKGGVAALLADDHGVETGEWLEDLVQREVIVRRPSPFPGEAMYDFRHELVRDAAYAMLPPADKQLSHRIAGEWLEFAGESDAVVLGEHFERGGELERASAWYRRGAEQALGANDLEAAIERAELGIALIPDGEPLGALLLVKAEATRWLGDPLAAERHAGMAVERLITGSLSWFHALGELIVASGRLGNTDAVERWAEEGRTTTAIPGAEGAQVMALCRAATQLLQNGRQDVADRVLDDVDHLALAVRADKLAVARHERVRANRAIYAGHTSDFLFHMQRALEASIVAGDLRNACSERVDIGFALAELGELAAAERALREAIETAGRLGIPQVEAWGWNNLGHVLFLGDDLAGAREAVARAVEAGARQRDRRLEGGSRIYLSAILLALGELPDAEEEARHAVDLLSVAPPRRAVALAMMAEVKLATGRAEAALPPISEAMALLERLGGLEEGEAMVRRVHAEILWALGRKDEAGLAVRAALGRIEQRARWIRDPAQRQSYLTRLPDVIKTRALLDVWRVGRS